MAQPKKHITEQERQKHLQFLVWAGVLLAFNEKGELLRFNMPKADRDYRKKVRSKVQYGIDTGIEHRVPTPLYHGRVRLAEESGEWEVDPHFNNAGDATGNRNIYALPTLSTSDQETAELFSSRRMMELRSLRKAEGATTEVFRILPYDTHSLVFDDDFDLSQYDLPEQKLILQSLRALTEADDSYALPVDFEHRSVASGVTELWEKYSLGVGTDVSSIVAGGSIIGKLLRKSGRIYSLEDIQQFYDAEIKGKKIDGVRTCDFEFVKKIVSIWNTKTLLLYDTSAIIRKFATTRTDDERDVYKHDDIEYPINLEYIASFLASNHIIGTEGQASSHTVSKYIESCYFFDLEAVNTADAVARHHGERAQKYGDFIDSLPSPAKGTPEWFPKKADGSQESLEEILQGSPEEIMEKLAYSSEYAEYFRTSDHNWEGFTIGQHTESVLRVLDDSYPDLPTELKNMMKLAILPHDMDKGHLRDQGIRTKGRENESAFKFYDLLNIDKKTQQLLKFIICDSQPLTSTFFLHERYEALDTLTQKSRDLLEKLFGTSQVNDQMVRCLTDMCVIMQTCDSGAYTRYGVTRREDGTYHFNGNDSFTDSFSTPVDPRRRELRFDNQQKYEQYMDELLPSTKLRKADTLKV